MVKTSYTFEVTAAQKLWLREMRRYAINSPRETGRVLPIFDVTEAKRRKSVVVPFLEYWDMNINVPLCNFQGLSVNELFFTSLPEYKDRCASCGANEASIYPVLTRFLRNCLIVPQDESFFFLCSLHDYWLLVAPLSLAEKLIGSTIDNSFSRFRRELSEGNFFDPSDEFYDFMLKTYEAHNRTLVGGT